MLIQKGTGAVVENITLNPSWIYDDMTFTGDRVWKTLYEFDTSSDTLEAKTTYYTKIVFDDKSDITGIFAFSPPVAEQTIQEAGEMLTNAETHPRVIPSWIKEIFSMYSDGLIDDETLLNAIEYLISVELIKIKKF